MVRTALALAGVLLVGACKDDAPAVESSWTLQASAAAGAALVHGGSGGPELLRIACRRNPPDLLVVAGTLRPVAGETVLDLGSGAFSVSLTADLSLDPQAGVQAAGPIPAAFLAALEAGGALSVTYAGQTLKLAAPEPELAGQFVKACRQATTQGG